MIKLTADLHCHTIFSDGRSSPEECVRAANKKGIDIIAITDHDTFEGVSAYHTKQPNLPVLVIPGEEVSTNKGHVLAYFIKEKINPGPFEKVVQQIQDQNGLAFLAHPFHISVTRFWNSPVIKVNKDELNQLDGFEIFNGHNRSRANSAALKLSLRQKKNFSFLSSSDSHYAWEIGGCTTTITVKDRRLCSVYQSLKTGLVQPNPPTRVNRLFNQWIYYWIGLNNRLEGKKYYFTDG